MNILIVCSGNSSLGISPFIKEQVNSLIDKGVSVDYFLIKGHGLLGYLKNLQKLKKIIRVEKYDAIHAHYGFSGLLATLQRSVPVIITFHGSDINVYRNKYFSKIAMCLSFYNIFVHDSIRKKAKAKKKYSIIPCGVNLKVFYPIDKYKARKLLKIPSEKIIIFFSSAFNNINKNFPLAKEATELLIKNNFEIIELKGYKPDKVNLLMNAADVLLVTSFSETGPLVVKEAMACNLPLVSTNVGDVKEVIGKTEGCFITSFDPNDVSCKIKRALDFRRRTVGRQKIKDKKLDKDTIANRILEVYKKINCNNIE